MYRASAIGSAGLEFEGNLNDCRAKRHGSPNRPAQGLSRSHGEASAAGAVT